MKLSNIKRDKRLKAIARVLIGTIIGAGVGVGTSAIASSVGSECLILCNPAVAIPYFAAMGLLAAWR
jgi:hypothetical protein